MTFSFYIGGYFHDHSYRLILNDDMLSISDYIGISDAEHDKTISVVNNKEWNMLVNFLKECRWKKRYDSETLDGTQWELKATGDDIIIKSYGFNAYPNDFDEFLVLLNKVIYSAGIEIKN